MENTNTQLVKNTIILGIGQLIPKILALVALPILTRYLSTSEYGMYDLFLTYVSLLTPLVTLQIQQAVLRYMFACKTADERSEYISCSIVFICVMSLVTLPICCIILRLLGVNWINSILICFLLLTESFYSIIGQITRGLGNNVKYSLGVVVYSFINVLLLFLLVSIYKNGLNGVILSLIIAYISANIFMIVSSRIFRYFSIKNFSKAKLIELLRFSVPIIPSSVSLWIVNLSDRMIVINYLGVAENGLYAVANKIPTIYNTAYGVFNLAWTETASRVSDESDPTNYYSSLFLLLYDFLIGAMLVMITITPIIYSVLVGDNYYESIYQVPFLYFGAFFNSFVNFYSGIYLALKKTKEVGISSMIGAVINVVINILLVKQMGLFAASLSTAISFFVIAIYRAYDLNKVIKIRYNFKNIIWGMLFFLISSIFLEIGGKYILCCLPLAISYNLLFNKEILKHMAVFLIKKIKRV